MELADGRQWLIPLARVFPAGTRLPEALAIGTDGRLIRRGLPRYAAACRNAERIWAAILAEDGQKPVSRQDAPGSTISTPGAPDAAPMAALVTPAGQAVASPISDEEAFLLAAEALGLNYRLGSDEVGMLGLLTTGNLKWVLGCFVDWPGYLAVLKAKAEAAAKKNGRDTPDGERSSPGGPV